MLRIILYVFIIWIALSSVSLIHKQNERIEDKLNILVDAKEENNKSCSSINQKMQAHYNRINDNTEYLVDELIRIREIKEVKYE